MKIDILRDIQEPIRTAINNLSGLELESEESRAEANRIANDLAALSNDLMRLECTIPLDFFWVCDGEHYPGCPEAIERDPPTEDDDDDEKPPTFDNHSFLE